MTTNEFLPDTYQQYIHLSRYARFREDLGRRETWRETIDRVMDYWINKENLSLSKIMIKELNKCRKDILETRIVPSMRTMLTAGKALDRDNVAGYNCAYLPIEHPRCFDEMMYILMCGTGVGFSVERQYVQKLPEVSEEMFETDTTIVVADSKIGWASSYRELISLLYSGKIPKWDVSKVRAAGERLKTFGGRASGPEPLINLFQFTVDKFKNAAGRQLSTLECHDIACKIAEVVVVGGVRRSALISLSDMDDTEMRRCKFGQWYHENPQRGLANNSYVVNGGGIPFQAFLDEWKSLYESKSGERGVFSRSASKNQVKKLGKRDKNHKFGTNPCSEIILRPYQFCNLSEVIIREDDKLDDLKDKVRSATIMGTMQSTLTEFRYLRKIWAKNTAEERLLGVSLTGIYDHPFMNNSRVNDAGYSNEFCGNEDATLDEVLDELREVTVQTNAEWAKRLKIPASTAITCVKPSGTTSQVCNTASGIHPRFSPYYIRTVRNDKKDPLSQFMIDRGFPYEDDKMNSSNYVFSFPIKSPESALCAEEIGAMEQLRLWQTYQRHWCEHKPSMTAYYNDNNFLEIGNWLWNNMNEISGVSFLPYSDHSYAQAPYQEISKEAYDEMLAKMPVNVDWTELINYEQEDNTVSMQALSCTGGVCEL